jgi:1,4-dihydroxy-2-naphthoate octaprenyltransferase
MVKMWIKALRVIPQINKDEWNHLDIFSRWLIASRGAVFVMTAIAAAIGGLLAYRFGNFSLSIFICALVGLVLAHATNNMLNDYVDSGKGIDKDNYYRAMYGPHPLEHGLLSKKQFLAYILITGILALITGVYITFKVGPSTLWFLGLGIFFLLFYTWPLKYFGLGELSVVFVWGPLMVGGTYFVVSNGHWNNWVALISLVYALGPTTVLLGKHADKLKEDKAKNVKTLPVIIGEEASRYTVIALFIIQYAFILLLGIKYHFGFALLLVFLSVPKFIETTKIFLQPRPEKEPENSKPTGWPLYLVAHAFNFNRRFGLLFLLGLIIELVIYKL